MIDFIIIAVIALIIGGAVWYVVKAKKSGKKCIGCPEGCCNSHKDGSACACCCGSKSTD